MRTGTAASTSSPARLRRRPKISRSSERRNRGDGAAADATGVGRAAQPLTSKPSPVSATNRSSRSAAPRPEARHRHAGVHAARRRPSRAATVAELGRHAAGRASRRRSARARAGPARPPRGWSVSTRTRGSAPAAQLGAACPGRPACPTCITPTWVQICSTSDEQVAGDQHGGALVGQRSPIRRRTSRVPCGSRPLVGSSRTSSSRGCSSAAAMRRAAAACRASRRGSACRRRPAGRPGPARRRSARRAVRRVGGAVGGVEPGAGCPGRTGTGGTPAPRPARRPAAAPRRAPCRHRPPEQLDGCPTVGPDQAEQHPDRGGLARAVRARGSRRPRRAGTARSMRVDRDLAAPNRLVSPVGARSRRGVGHRRLRQRRRSRAGRRRHRRRPRTRPSSVSTDARTACRCSSVARAPARR